MATSSQGGSQPNITTTSAVTPKRGGTYDGAAGPSGIPCAVPAPKQKPVPLTRQVVFDLGITGLENECHILRISASSLYLPVNAKDFNKFVLPKKEISYWVRKNFNYYIQGHNLYRNGRLVDAIPIRKALSEFLGFLGDEPVTLLAHHSRRIDFSVLFNAMKACNMMAEFERKVTGFVDTLPLFREVWRNSPSHGLHALYNELFPDEERKKSNVMVLKTLVEQSVVTEEAVSRRSFDLRYVAQVAKRSFEKKNNLPSWKPMIASESVSRFMAQRAAASGLGVYHLQLAYEWDGEQGVQDVLSEIASDGKPRVTASKTVLAKISSYIAKHPVDDERENESMEDMEDFSLE